MRTILFGSNAGELRAEAVKYPELEMVETAPDVVICYGGDGTLLAAERNWPHVPKVPIRNSRRGKRCIAHPPAAVIERLARNELVRTEYMKLEVHVGHINGEVAPFRLTAMNEFNVHMGRINSAVRFAVWIDEEPYNDGQEILGDGFVISTPFGSTAYYNQITRGVFHRGLGLAFKHTTEHTNHVVAPEDVTIRVLITRGPAVLGCDNATEFHELGAGHELVARKHAHPSVLLTWERMSHPSDQF